MILVSFLVALQVFIVSIVPFTFHHELHSAVNDLRLRKHPLADIFPAVGTLLLPNQTLIDALFAEGVTTNGGAAAHNVVHTDGTVEFIHVFEGLVQG